jgi:hypothetical protein
VCGSARAIERAAHARSLDGLDSISLDVTTYLAFGEVHAQTMC